MGVGSGRVAAGHLAKDIDTPSIIVGEPLVRRKPAMRPAMSARLARRMAAAVPKRERRHKECAETEGARATGMSRRAY